MVSMVTAGGVPSCAATLATVAHTAPVAKSRLSPGRKGVTTNPVSANTMRPSMT